MGFEAGDEIEGGLRLFVAAAGLLLELGFLFFERVHVGEEELGIDDLDVADGVDGVADVFDVGVLEAADDLDDGVDLADVGEELIAEAFALAGACDEAGDVDELEDGGDGFFAGGELGEGVEAGIGDGDDAFVGFDGTEPVVGGHGLTGFGEGVKEGTFAYVGETNNACLQHEWETTV